MIGKITLDFLFAMAARFGYGSDRSLKCGQLPLIHKEVESKKVEAIKRAKSAIMKRKLTMFRRIILPLFSFLFVINGGVWAKSIEEGGGLGPQSTQAIGEKSVLVVVVRFPDATPTTPIETVQKRVVAGLGSYVDEQSYGLASIKTDFRGYVTLPDSLADYKISPYNFRVDKSRIRKLIEDTMTAIEKEIDFSVYDNILIIPAVNTMQGKGYGMICYCANPGML